MVLLTSMPHGLPVVLVRVDVSVADQLQPGRGRDLGAAGDVVPVRAPRVPLRPGAAMEGHGRSPPAPDLVDKRVRDVLVVVEGLAGLHGGNRQSFIIISCSFAGVH